MGSTVRQFYEFGPYRIDPTRSLLLRGEERILLTSKALETLLILVEHSERVVSKDELIRRLWPDTFVEEANLTQHISMVRKALGDTAEEHRYIVTLPGRGYRFVEQVRIVSEGGSVAGAAESLAAPVAERSKTSRAKAIAAGILTAGAVVASLLAAVHFMRIRPKFAPLQKRVMLLVLPFQNLSNDPEQEYFSDGLTDETITDLGRLSSDKLGVIARTSAMAYKHTNKTASQLGQELGVDYILEGSVRREGARLRINAQLVRAKDQAHVWASSYDRDLREILALQGELGEAITHQVEASLTVQQRLQQAKAREIDPEAYDDYLRGLSSWNQFTPDELRKSVDYFQRAIEKDPKYAQAYARLSQSYAVLMDWKKLPTTEAHAESEAAARKSVALDDRSSEAHAALGWQLLYYDRNFTGAGREFQRATELNPSNADAHSGLANYFAATGHFDQSLAEMRTARDMDPLSLVTNMDLGKMLFYARQYDSAIRQLRLTLDLHPDSFAPHYVLSLIYQAQGRNEEAYEEFFKEMTAGGIDARMTELQRTHLKSGWQAAWQKVLGMKLVSTWDLAGIALALDDKKQTLDLLDKAIDERLGQVIFLNVDPRYDRLHPDPGFQELVRRLKLAS